MLSGGYWKKNYSTKPAPSPGIIKSKDRKKDIHHTWYDGYSNTIVISTATGATMVQLETLEFRNIGERSYATYYPYTNFYTTELEEGSRIQKGELCMVKGRLLHDPCRGEEPK